MSGGGAQLCFEDEGLRECGDEMGAAFDLLEELKGFAGEDVSFAEYLDHRGVAGEERGSAIGYVEGFNAADARVASARALGVRVFKVRGGYHRLPEYLAGRVRELGGVVRTGMRVRRVLWERGRVELVTDAGRIVARRAVVTLPLGVLLQGEVTIEPEPGEVMRAAAGMRMGQVCRFTMTFRRRFWEEIEPRSAMRELSFLFTVCGRRGRCLDGSRRLAVLWSLVRACLE